MEPSGGYWQAAYGAKGATSALPCHSFAPAGDALKLLMSPMGFEPQTFGFVEQCTAN